MSVNVRLDDKLWAEVSGRARACHRSATRELARLVRFALDQAPVEHEGTGPLYPSGRPAAVKRGGARGPRTAIAEAQLETAQKIDEETMALAERLATTELACRHPLHRRVGKRCFACGEDVPV